jgi:hypothetical protein
MRKRPLGVFMAVYDRSFSALAPVPKPISKAMKSMSVKLFTNRELALLQISYAKEFPVPFRTVL